MMGIAPADIPAPLIEAGADIIGTTCGNGAAQMIDIVREMRTASPHTPILVHANAGMPVNVNGKDTFPEKPAETAQFVPALIQAGASIIGGCCGTTPEHIAAIRKAVESIPHSSPRQKTRIIQNKEPIS